MWLSKLILNPRSWAARRDLTNPYEMHRTLSWSVAEALQTRQERLLWRVEPVRFGPPVVLVQTLTKPDWSRVFARFPHYGELDPTSPKFFQPAFSPGQTLRFRLLANPTVKRLEKRHALWGREEKVEWLHRKLAAAGAEVLQVMIAGERRVQAWKPKEEEVTPIIFYAVLYEGLLRVVDPPRLEAALVKGIGPAKGLGMGLLSLARVR
ncbi:MAG: type I-E CRISPR-associated protein Cas6/Cse3/CasE [Candidatus Bipolaricaulaceae bacterium]